MAKVLGMPESKVAALLLPHGTVEIVKYFVTKVVPPTTRYFHYNECL